jgi:hypothetical protein
MQKGVLLIGGLTLAMGLAWGAEDAPADHVNWMKDLGRQSGAIRKGVDVEKNALEMQATLKLVGAFWKARNSDPAVKSCEENYKGAQAVGAAAKANNAEGIAAGAKLIGAGCKGCHDAHREKTGPEQYKIK